MTAMQPLQLIQQSGPKPPYPSQPPMIRTASLDLGMQMPHTGIPPASFYATNDPTVRPSPPESSRVDYQTALYQQQQQQQQMQAGPQNSVHMICVLLLSHYLSLSNRLRHFSMLCTGYAPCTTVHISCTGYTFPRWPALPIWYCSCHPVLKHCFFYDRMPLLTPTSFRHLVRHAGEHSIPIL